MKSAWLQYNENEKQNVFSFNEQYMKMISKAKTERLFISEAIALAKAKGYQDIQDVIENQKELKPGDKVYVNMMNKSMALMNIGTDPLEKGLNILGAHVDSPRLDVKPNPLYEDGGLALLDLHYYGGIKKYQWVTVPLALMGVVCLKDGTTKEISIGTKENDPVFVVSDLLIHLSQERMKENASNVIPGENLNVTFGNIPVADEEKEAIKKNCLAILKNQYGIEEEDFFSAELEFVPAGPARSCGLDSSMVIGYGQDDRVCAYTSLMAQLDCESVKRTSVTLLVDKEEVGSQGATGMHSQFFENFVREILYAMGYKDERTLKRTLQNSTMLSSDVAAAHDPNYPEASSPNNQAYLGCGVALLKYVGARGKSGSNDANAEYMAHLRNIMDQNHVKIQYVELGKVDLGGGGTIAYILANYGMQVVDFGVPVLNMHSPFEVSSKADVYEAYKGYKAFLQNMN
ncbi:Probable M18 family aminopeptidase 1 [Faecalicoccus pleomorphus]|uniref:M18 family aminopeptidase n=1 Tax=Faecalicoccus pleomorphus TaxID=1323 RepID=A0A380LML4_9FIRM|nr:aminopeptidase [Faecalicoccus pleomorphus]SUO04042.1 Probable M18 family aminopeptidase 1 [Faecalicoccus pleomorphus]